MSNDEIKNLGGVDNCLDKHFLAERKIKPLGVSQLLSSASFGANAVLYAVWLGYLMGVWAITIHTRQLFLNVQYAEKHFEC